MYSFFPGHSIKLLVQAAVEIIKCRQFNKRQLHRFDSLAGFENILSADWEHPSSTFSSRFFYGVARHSLVSASVVESQCSVDKSTCHKWQIPHPIM
jgi:hypothetical protein